MLALHQGLEVTQAPVWPDLPPEPDTCFCHHPLASHDNGWCTHRSYAEICSCTRYRNLAEIRRGRREDAWWETVGGHDW